uniref:Uncharacterized protein n=1 Tax=Elaeophora elaphi TaxID=1147741 RepID=A0A0R3S6I0_9BILA
MNAFFFILCIIYRELVEFFRIRTIGVRIYIEFEDVNTVSDRRARERYLQQIGRREDSYMHQRSGDIDNNGDGDGDSDKREQANSHAWEEWMRNQPISVLRLDRTERLVLKIGGSSFFKKKKKKKKAFKI